MSSALFGILILFLFVIGFIWGYSSGIVNSLMPILAAIIAFIILSGVDDVLIEKFVNHELTNVLYEDVKQNVLKKENSADDFPESGLKDFFEKGEVSRNSTKERISNWLNTVSKKQVVLFVIFNLLFLLILGIMTFVKQSSGITGLSLGGIERPLGGVLGIGFALLVIWTFSYLIDYSNFHNLAELKKIANGSNLYNALVNIRPFN